MVARDRHASSHVRDPSTPFGRSGQIPSLGIWLTIRAPPPMFFISVASKGLRLAVSVLKSTLMGDHVSVDSKGVGG